ncbi:hypothetical protein N7468_006062 [Penicillium chermesinum]|uniref:Thioredoxin domain-containing protein n=1 Tax=Penicillium chermesinum TaxID=63820 RepID=A0A9W9TNI9_9EURO|nr:uncharacterized protein N7468_006062 [Penicillium chermesinum]KAJ5233106.1 hypothetical protein N7468_006062 [Penicillium chermesinum]KAJ6172739.1 hypothetical protein N7470_001806 [Penicillium chermesinum]
MSALTEITTEGDFAAHLNSLPPSALVVLYFYAPWAAPCTQMRAVLSALAQQYPVTTPPSISFVSMNAEELPDISEEYEVTSVPHTVCVRNGQVLESIGGSDAIKVRNAVERYASGAAAPAHASNIPPALSAAPRENGPAVATQPPVVAPNAAAAGAAANAIPVAPTESAEDLDERIKNLVKAAPIMLFMKGTPSEPQCGFSRQLVGILREQRVRYGFFNILADEDVRQRLKEIAEWPTYPQLWANGNLEGGLDIIRESLTENPNYLHELVNASAQG